VRIAQNSLLTDIACTFLEALMLWVRESKWWLTDTLSIALLCLNSFGLIINKHASNGNETGRNLGLRQTKNEASWP
jgi:hypothetical protein